MVGRTHSLTAVPGLALCALATSSLLALAQEPGKSTHPEDSPGPQGQTTSNGPPAVTRYGRFLVGDAAPDVVLSDQANVRFHLGTARREKGQMLVFARTPNDVRTVDAVTKELEALGIGVVAIAPFRRDRVVPSNAPMNVRLLTDGASITARNYGVFDAVTSNPRPAVFLIDRAGKIQMMMAGGFPGDGELVRLTRESLERAGELVAQPPPVIE
jgi:peroxiredoxin